MKNPNLDEAIKSSKIFIHHGRYAYLKAVETETLIGNHFFISKDKDEITIVTEEKNIFDVKYSQDEKWFKLIEIKVSLPFLVKGFLAKVTRTIADKDLNILVVSTFSKDYILIREEFCEIAIEALRKIGFPTKIE